MKPVRHFAAERRAVQHCAQLFGTAPSAFDLRVACAEFAAELAQALPDQIQPLLIGPRSLVSEWPGETIAASDLASQWSGQAIHYAIAFGPGMPVFVASFDAALALALTDRMFGGRGQTADDAGKVLPQSAVIAVRRLVRAAAQAIGSLFATGPGVPEISEHAVLRRLGVFKRSEPAIALSFTVEQEGHDPWSLRLTAPQAALRPMLEQRAAGAAKPLPGEPGNPLAGAAAAIPIPLTAVLADVEIPVSRLAALQPGDAIPLSPRREVPLMAGTRVVAVGAVGAIDERAALRLTRLA